MTMHSSQATLNSGLSALSYADAVESWLGRKIITLSEQLSGRRHYEALYRIWCGEIVPSNERVFGRMLELIDIDLAVQGALPKAAPDDRLMLIANHPYGIGDGIAMLALAEQLGRPFRVLINSELLRIPEMRPYSLPIDFHETKEAQRNNLAVRREALELIRKGVTIVVFPAGAVATATKPWGRAADWPWKLFPARLIQDAQASVVPIHFAGQNGRLFHLASHISLTARMSMLVREFTKLSGGSVHARIGDVLPWSSLEPIRDRKALTAHLRAAVFDLSPDGDDARSGGAVIDPLY
ncbi:lysophospholipid acyltransferase family protein [Tianweitania populi]|uniref:Glycerol acyltransferase n=1 Tax=Tianweitania populi TaxID=1607949 RepID=A0A8J3GKP6_9HYPH|nr:lysophospholipid acyltransferase family protein [Tianweitania populi]GHD08411.1 glycerol acyltransferase [Tianweitania populi]